jgi:transposase
MNNPRRSYPTELRDAEWARVAKRVPAVKSGGRPALYSRREIVNAILYVQRSDCAWRLLPHDLPPRETVYGYFNRWCKAGVWERMRQVLYQQLRIELKRQPIGEDHRKGGVKGFDYPKRVKGRKRHILVDTEGLLMVIQVTAASVQDHRQAMSLLQAGREPSTRLEKVWVDEGYQSTELQQRAQAELKLDVEIVPKPSGSTGFQGVPRRSVVERTFA